MTIRNDPSAQRPIHNQTPLAEQQPTTTEPRQGQAPGRAGLDGAAQSGRAPSASGDRAIGQDSGPQVPSGLQGPTVRGQQPVIKPRATAFDLVEGRYPEAVSLPQVLRGLASSPDAKALVKKVIADFEASTGVQVPEAMVNAAIANPDRLVDLLQMTPAQMSAGFDALNAAHRAGRIDDVAPLVRHLPQHFDLADIDNLEVARPEPELKEIAPGLLKGSLKSDLSDDAAKRNIVIAEVFDRLADNANIPADERFSVKYNGGEYTRVDTFLGALRAAGHQVEARVSHRVANFADLKTRAPDGTILDVPAPLMIRTGERDADGNEALVPAVHSELVISIKAGPDVTGPAIDAGLKWYQGVTSTGFFPVDLFQTPRWLGGTISDTFTGDQAAKAVELAGLLSDVINDASKEAGLVASGYGITGVCNDSVAIIQHVLTGRTTAYPLLMRDATLLGEIERRTSDRNHRDDPEYRALRDSITAVPSDVETNASSRERALASLPWAAGTEPFVSTTHALAVLSGGGRD